jgi:hypothetical protein
MKRPIRLALPKQQAPKGQGRLLPIAATELPKHTGCCHGSISDNC